MGIDVCFVEIDGDQWTLTEDGDRVGSTGDFINLAMQLTLVIEQMKQMDPEPIHFALGALREFVDDDRDTKLAAFAEYADFIVETSRMMRENATEVFAGPPPVLNVEFIDEEVRGFLAGLMLSKNPVAPNLCEHLAPYIGISLGLLNAFAEQLESDNMEMSRLLHQAYQTLDVARNYCDAAIEHGQHIYFDF